ncbi:DUF4339 domain-containing protein [Vicingus serpentipes]|uniref:DUF4339 domain-containing protein n=1 Tax=Vicingus serpentipes TaxID=1926625 RepID=A0A5C6RZR7_9FLAO|nr:DUF4339 domain-containing protein [Vicingus serpentipes]TXB66862.1 DUF4339 domain-containing protein [Vicingus serpentipes]
MINNKKYFIVIDNKQEGPFTKEELIAKSIRITDETLVWSKGFPDWKKAKEVDDLMSLLISVPPPIPSVSKSEKVEVEFSKKVEVEVSKKEKDYSDFKRKFAINFKREAIIIIMIFALDFLLYILVYWEPLRNRLHNDVIWFFRNPFPFFFSAWSIRLVYVVIKWLNRYAK